MARFASAYSAAQSRPSSGSCRRRGQPESQGAASTGNRQVSDQTRFVLLIRNMRGYRRFPAAEQAMLPLPLSLISGTPKTAVLLSDFYELAGKPDQAAKVLGDYLPPYQPGSARRYGVELHLASLLASKPVRSGLAVLSQRRRTPSRPTAARLLIDAHRLPEAEKVLSDLSAIALSPDLLTLKGVAALDSALPPSSMKHASASIRSSRPSP